VTVPPLPTLMAIEPEPRLPLELDEPEETIELEPNLFGVAEEALGVPGDDIEDVDLEASEDDELAEDVLTVEEDAELAEELPEADPEENFEEQP